MSKIKRKRKMVIGLTTAAVVTIGGLLLVNSLEVANTNAGFQKTANAEATVSAGNLELTMHKVTGVDVANAGDDSVNTTGGQIGDLVGNTTVNNGEGKLIYTISYDNISPGWSDCFSFKVENTGTLDAKTNVWLGSMHDTSTPVTADEDWDEKDPRAKINYTLYMVKGGSDLPASITKVANGKLSDYQNFALPTKIADTDVTLASGDAAESCYYVIKLEFVDSGEAYSSNESGDNVYSNSKIKVNFAISASDTRGGDFRFE